MNNQNPLAAVLPVYSDGEVDLQKLSSLMGVPKKDMADLIGISQSTAQRRLTASTLTKAQPVLHMLNMLWQILEGAQKPQEIRRWLNEPRIAWRGMTPINCIKIGKINAVIELLETHLEGEITGV
jgi:hypothetical protein